MDTIAAMATARGTAGVGVLRISGEEAVATAEQVVRRPNGAALADAPARTLVRCALLDGSGAVIDDILAVVFPALHSYTGEHVNCSATARRWCWKKECGRCLLPGRGRRGPANLQNGLS